MAYVSTEPTSVGIPASSPILSPRKPPPSSCRRSHPGPRNWVVRGGEDTGGESWGWGRCRQPRRQSAVPVIPGERVGNLGEEKARILRTHPPQKSLEMLQNI